MTHLKKKTAQNHANVRKHCLFRSNEISLINEATAKAKVSFSQGIGANLSHDEKRAHLADLKREHLIDQVCTQEILPPER